MTAAPPCPAGVNRAGKSSPVAKFGVRTVPTIECNSAADAVAAATRLGYPVVLKGVADGVAHKSDLGLVHVGLRDPDAVAGACGGG